MQRFPLPPQLWRPSGGLIGPSGIVCSIVAICITTPYPARRFFSSVRVLSVIWETMKAISIASPRKARLTYLPQPSLGQGDALLRIQLIGLCGTDLNTYRGLNPLVSYPRILGHEIAAVIERCGAQVPESWQPGMLVTCSPYTSCGECSACMMGRFNACKFNQTLGVQRDGALTELIAVPWQKLFHAPRLDGCTRALVEPLAVGFHATERGCIFQGDRVLVFGAGLVGLGAIAAAAAAGAGQVIAVDLDDKKLALARKAGATSVINSMKENLHQRVIDLTQGFGPGLVIEAVGAVETFVAAVDEVCHAGRVVYVGYANQPVSYETKHFLLKELDIRGSRGSTAENFQKVMHTLESGSFPISETVTLTVCLDDVPAVMHDWDRKPDDFTKIHVQVNESSDDSYL